MLDAKQILALKQKNKNASYTGGYLLAPGPLVISQTLLNVAVFRNNNFLLSLPLIGVYRIIYKAIPFYHHVYYK